MLSELGPFYPTLDGAHLLKNPYSWNKGRDRIPFRLLYFQCACDRVISGRMWQFRAPPFFLVTLGLTSDAATFVSAQFPICSSLSLQPE